jgi:hypothetical protein
MEAPTEGIPCGIEFRTVGREARDKEAWGRAWDRNPSAAPAKKNGIACNSEASSCWSAMLEIAKLLGVFV